MYTPRTSLRIGAREMGLASTKMQLRNPRLPELAAVEIGALADTGAVHMCIPQHIKIQLQLEEQDTKEVTLGGWKSKARAIRRPDRASLQEPDWFRGRVGHARRTSAGSHSDGSHGPGGSAQDSANDRQSAESQRCLVHRQTCERPSELRKRRCSKLNLLPGSGTGRSCG